MSTAAAAIAGARFAVQRQQQYRHQQEQYHRQQQQQHWRPTADPSVVRERQARADAEMQASREHARKAQAVYNLLISLPTHLHEVSTARPADAVTECAICLGAFATGDKLKTLPCDGQHAFHSRCLRQWFQKGKTSCPSCRYECSPAQPDFG